MRPKQVTQYEFSNLPITIGMGKVLRRVEHCLPRLGVVKSTTVTDKKIPVDDGNNGTIDYYVADITSATDYYPFGSPMDGRTFSSDKYRFGFNGKENDNEVKGDGGQQDYGLRIYDTRLGRFLSVDPLSTKYPWYTPYQFAGNNPIQFIDLDGAEPITSNELANGAIDEAAKNKDLQTTVFDKDKNGKRKEADDIEKEKQQFLTDLRELINNPELLNQTNLTNFCGKAAAAAAFGLKDNPLGMATFMMDLYFTGEATYDNYKGKGVTIKLKKNIKKLMDFNIESKSEKDGIKEGVAKINSAFCLLAHAQTQKYNAGLGFFRGGGSANGMWASTTAKLEEKLIEDFYGYEIESSDASNTYFNRDASSLFNALVAVESGYTVIGLVNSRILHSKPNRRWSLMTHFLILEPFGKKWEYGFSENNNYGLLIKSWCGSIIVNQADNFRKPR